VYARSITPEVFFQYTYAILYTPTYRGTYADFLKIVAQGPQGASPLDRRRPDLLPHRHRPGQDDRDSIQAELDELYPAVEENLLEVRFDH
jgi:hypothetical protein